MLIVAAMVVLPPVKAARGAEKIKIMLPGPSTAFAPLYHAKSAGYFTDEGLDVEILMATGPAGIQALIARDVHFALTPGTFQIQAYERGQRLVAVMSILTHTHINVVMHKEVAKAKGITEKSPLVEKMRALKGLKVSGVAPGAISHQMLIYCLLKAGLDPQKDVEIVGLGAAPTLLAALEQRQIDAFATGTPTPEAAAIRGFGVMVLDNAAGEDPDFGEFMGQVLIAPLETLRQRPELVRKVVRALLKSSAWVLDHPDEQVVPILQPALGRLDEQIILAGLKKTRVSLPRDGRITERAVALTQEFLRKVGALKATIPYDQLVSNDFLPR
jgi:ABC-type nitrate/sulfonate/bicarbonate transport system substrate-binding protein